MYLVYRLARTTLFLNEISVRIVMNGRQYTVDLILHFNSYVDTFTYDKTVYTFNNSKVNNFLKHHITFH